MLLAEITPGVGATATQGGIGLGSILAGTFAWTRSRSILVCILAGIFSWIYVIYFALTRRPSERARE
jgi:hypothetical protein